jgi:hypothetical protein
LASDAFSLIGEALGGQRSARFIDEVASLIDCVGNCQSFDNGSFGLLARRADQRHCLERGLDRLALELGVVVRAQRDTFGQGLHVSDTSDCQRYGLAALARSGKHSADSAPSVGVNVVTATHADQTTNRIMHGHHGALAELASEPLGRYLLPWQRTVFGLNLFGRKRKSVDLGGGRDFASEFDGWR